jgi:hypothetical protein
VFAHFLSYLPVDFLNLVFADFLCSNTLSTGISFQVFPIATGRHLIFTACDKVRESLALTVLVHVTRIKQQLVNLSCFAVSFRIIYFDIEPLDVYQKQGVTYTKPSFETLFF